MKIAITGANSSVGINLLEHIARNEELQASAGARSKNALSQLPRSERITPCEIDYNNVDSLGRIVEGADCVVHLAGILIENKHSNYAAANVEATRTVVEAAKSAGVKHFVFISVIGADYHSKNKYFQSKGQAEALVAASGMSVSILRTPILLGPGTAGANSVVWATNQSKAKLLGGGKNTMNPLDVDDLSAAILNCCHKQLHGINYYELLGPESILYRDLIKRVAAAQGKNITIGTFPVWVAKLLGSVTSKIRRGGITPTVVDVITLDEKFEKNAAAELGISLTPLDATIEKMLSA